MARGEYRERYTLYGAGGEGVEYTRAAGVNAELYRRPWADAYLRGCGKLDAIVSLPVHIPSVNTMVCYGYPRG